MSVRAEDVVKVLRVLYDGAKEGEESKGKGKEKGKGKGKVGRREDDMDGDE